MAGYAILVSAREADMPCVSVIILTWNGKKFLTKCLDSLAAQTYRDFETILVDNGSMGGLVDYVRNAYPWVRLALPEVAGGADALFEPRSPEEMANRIWSVWESATEQQRLREAGFERVKSFGWEGVARKTLAVYERAGEGFRTRLS